MLFSNTKQILPFAEFTANLNFATIAATLLSVEEQYIIPIIGKPQFDELATFLKAVDDEGELDARIADLLFRCRRVAGPMLAYMYAPKGEVKLSDSGLRREETPTLKSVFQYQGTNFKEACLSEAEASTELLLQFLYENQSQFPLWVLDKSSDKYRKLFIKDAATFDSNFKTQSPYRNFTAMRFKMYDVEQLHIRTKISPALFDYLKTKDLNSGIFTDAETELMEKLYKAITYLTIAFSLPFLRVRIDANGITVMNSRPSSTNDALNSRTAADKDAISGIMTSCAEDGATWLQNAMDFVLANLPEFPSYVVPVAAQLPAGNDCRRGSVSLG